MKGLDEVMRLKRAHRRWVFCNAIFGAGPLFAILNKVHPILTDGYDGDLLPTLFPEAIRAQYNTMLAVLLAGLAASELLRRRFHRVHEKDLNL